MIPAKTAREETKIENYIKEKCKEIERSIQVSMDMGFSYTRYHERLPPSIIEMLKEYGYEVIPYGEELLSMPGYLIIWGNSEKDIKCN